MAATTVIHAYYDDDDVLMHAVKKVKAEKHHIEEVYCPFPVHGLDKAMYGCLGLIVSIVMMKYIMIDAWPMDIGGKPSFSYIENMPAFVPIMFELTVFFAAHLMVITFYLRSRLWPFKKAENPDVRTTDAHFIMEIEVHNNESALKDLLLDTGAVELNIIKNNH